MWGRSPDPPIVVGLSPGFADGNFASRERAEYTRGTATVLWHWGYDPQRFAPARAERVD